MAAPAFPVVCSYFSKAQVPEKEPFNFFFMKSFQRFQLSWSLLGILPDDSSCCLLIVMKNLFQIGKLLQVLLRDDPKSDPFRTPSKKKHYFSRQQLRPEDSLAVFIIKRKLGKL